MFENSRILPADASSKLVIFDCDGVLVDSEPITMTVMSEMLDELGLQLNPYSALKQFRGRKIADCFAEITSRTRLEFDDKFLADFRQRCNDRYVDELVAMPGLREAIENLQEPFCVATSAPRAKVHHMLRIVGLLDLFEDKIFSAYEVGAWKPDPKLFLTAAKCNAVIPANCVVIEDSAVGLKAARNAGMHAIHFRASEDVCRVPGTAPEMSHFNELPEILARWRHSLERTNFYSA